MKQFLKIGTLLCLAAAIVAGCAEERDPINRVQPYAIPKSFFIGEDYNDNRDDPEFYGRHTVTDVGYGASQSLLFASTIGQNVARMYWEVTESYLIGRASYERIRNSDYHGVLPKDASGQIVGAATHNGVITAKFRINKHFDIVNMYNSTTGEKLNVLEENAWDRPWNERDYVRVDWSRNLNTDSYDFDTLSLVGVYGSIMYEPYSHWIDDPNHPDAPVFDFENNYFDVTTKVFAKPGLINLSHLGWGIDSFPACFLPNDFFGGTQPTGSCNPIEITMRHSFMKVVDNDFQPEEVDSADFTTFGTFYADKYGYSRLYRMTDELWHRFAQKYNVWERSHYYEDMDAMTEPVECFTPDTYTYGDDASIDAHCANNVTGKSYSYKGENYTASAGSVCDIFKQKCTLPYVDRVAKPMVWYYTEGGDPKYFDASHRAVNNWDAVMRTSVQLAKQVDCTRNSGDAEACQAEYPMYTGQQTDNDDLISLSWEVDLCRAGKVNPELNGECDTLAESLGAARGYSEGVITMAKAPEMVVLCHSPVLWEDNALCADEAHRLPEGVTEDDCILNDNQLEGIDEALSEQCANALRARRGDLRYHSINVIPDPAVPSPWGIMVSATDPVTGENFATSANVWSWVNDYWAAALVDQMRLVKGELSAEDIAGAEHVADWGQASEAASKGGVFGYLKKDEVNRRVAEFGNATISDLNKANVGTTKPGFATDTFSLNTPELKLKADELKANLKTIVADAKAPSTVGPMIEGRRKAARGTPFEMELMTDHVQLLNGIQGMEMSDSILNLTSPLRGGDPIMKRNFDRMLQNGMADRGMCMMTADEMAQAPMSISNLADIFETKFEPFNGDDSAVAQEKRAERMRNYIAKSAHLAVIVHEIGHSFGHRHNFVSSSDPYNYRPQYWQLRTKDGAVSSSFCTSLGDGEDCVGPRYIDPVTDAEKEGLIWMWQQSSVMDYAGEPTQDFLGLAAYDVAAAHKFYGGVVHVYDNENIRAGNGQISAAIVDKWAMRFGGVTGITYDSFPGAIHYSRLDASLAEVGGLIQNCVDVDPANFQPVDWDEEASGKFHAVLDGHIVSPNGDGIYTRCHQMPIGYAHWDDMRMPEGAESLGYYEDRGFQCIEKGTNRIMVPYGFATDRWADLGNASVYRHDNGADIYEIFNYLVSNMEVSHLFDNYRRGRVGFSLRGAAGRAFGRFNGKVRDGAKGIGLYKNLISDAFNKMGECGDCAWGSMYSQLASEEVMVGASMVFDHFARELTRPQSGGHDSTRFIEGLQFYDANEGKALSGSVDRLNIFDGVSNIFGNISVNGRPVGVDYKNDEGDFATDYVMNCGSYYNKMYAALHFAESADNFVAQGRDVFVDPRYRAISLASLFPNGFRRLLGAALAGDYYVSAPRVAADVNGSPLIDSQRYPTESMGWQSWWGDDLRTCFVEEGSNVCGAWPNTTVGTGSGPANVALVDPQIGWEQQKFLIAWTLLYIVENHMQDWINQMRVWELGIDGDPTFQNRIELHHPEGKTYIAKTYGKEELQGKTVQKGIAARVLEKANQLMAEAYVGTEVDVDGDGETEWIVADMVDGHAVVRYDEYAHSQPSALSGWPADCNATDNSGCTCESNSACVELRQYMSIPFFMRQAVNAYALDGSNVQGIYD